MDEWTWRTRARVVWESEPESEGPPKRWAVLASLARAKGLLPSERRGRVIAFNARQKAYRGPVIELPCTVVN